MQEPPERMFNVENFVPELREIFTQLPLDPGKTLRVAVALKTSDERGEKSIPTELPRNQIAITDGTNVWNWKVDSLRSLFRGNRQPPVLGAYPEAYQDSLLLLDLHALEISTFIGDRRDAEMKEVYSALRRRPDGPSRGVAHDYLWKAAALVLGTRPLSQAEFEAITTRLERSCRTFEDGPASRNYIAALRSTL